MTEQEISQLPEHLKVKLIKHGFKELDKKIRTTYRFHAKKPRLTRLWHEVSDTLEEIQNEQR